MSTAAILDYSFGVGGAACFNCLSVKSELEENTMGTQESNVKFNLKCTEQCDALPG